MHPWQHIHPDFQLSGKAMSLDELRQEARILASSKEVEDQHRGQFLLQWLDDQLTVSVPTSGSTGIPKSIELDKLQMMASARATISYFDLPPKTTALLCLSTAFIAGKMMWVRALLGGWNLDVGEVSSDPLSRKQNKYQFAAMVPYQVTQSLTRLQQVDKLIIGGAAVTADLEQQLQSSPCECYATYGMTETITHVAVKKLNRTGNTNSVYEALPGVRFSQDNRGCLVIDAPAVSTQQVVTNDVVHLFSESQFEWLGRADFVINSGGVKIHPEQLEKKLSTTLSVPFFITGVTDSTWGEKVVLVVESSRELPLDFSHLKPYEIPKEICYVPAFVYTGSGKINRKATLSKIGD